MIKKVKEMTYRYFPGSKQEEHKSFKIFVAATDLHISITDKKTKKTLTFRFAGSGEFADTNPEVMEALGELHRAFEKEAK